MKFQRRPYQKPITSFIVSKKRCNIWATMGSGKTGATLWAINSLYATGAMADWDPETETGDRVLILAPLRVASITWPDEQEKWQFANIRITDATGKPAWREQALLSDANVVCTNYESIDWLLNYYGKDWPFSMVVADESTKLKGFRTRQGSKRAKALSKIAHKELRHGFRVNRWVNLTGTPAPNGLIDLWGQQWFVDGGNALGSSYTAFTDRFFNSVRVGNNAFAVQKIPTKSADKQIHRLLKSSSLTVDAAEYFGCDKPTSVPVVVALPPKARKYYDEMEKVLRVELESGEVEAANAAAKTAKCLQIAGGAVYLSDADGDASKEWQELHDAKLQGLESIVDELSGAPLLVSYQYRHDVPRILKRFPQAVALAKGRKADEQVRAWNAGKIPMLLVHPASAGHGLNLQDGGHHLAIFNDTWNYEHYAQVIERIGPIRQMQAGHPRPVFVYHIQAKGTLDQVIAQRRDGKKSVQDLVMEYMKEKNA